MKITLIGFGLKRGNAILLAIQDMLPKKVNEKTEILLGRNFSYARQSLEIKTGQKEMKYAEKIIKLVRGKSRHFKTVFGSESHTFRCQFSNPKLSKRKSMELD